MTTLSQLIVTSYLFLHCALGEVKYPVVLVPGDGGSQFEARLNKPETVHWWCSSESDWFSLWLNIGLLAPHAVDCLVDNMRLDYDLTTRTSHNRPGVEIRQTDFGNTSTVEYFASSQIFFSSYFNPIVEALLPLGYKRGVSLRGAPYDFRKAPNEMQDFLTNLIKLIEDTYNLNEKKKVVLLGHSMGNLYILNLLNQQPSSWKNKYIRSFISLAAPYGGVVKILSVVTSGSNEGIVFVNPVTIRPQQRTPSAFWMLPYEGFWSDKEVLVSGPLGNYTVKDYKKFFSDINFDVGYYMRQDTEKYLRDMKAPGVEMHCLHGVNVSTPAALHYTKSSWHDSQPDVTYGDGDGTVNLRSLHGCLRWQDKQKPKIYHKSLPGVNHSGVLSDAKVLEYIKTTLSQL